MNSDKQINLRARQEQKQLIARAARATHKSLTEFMLDAATAAAHDALLNQNEFILDESEFRDFMQRLNQPVSRNRALKALLESSPPWDR